MPEFVFRAAKMCVVMIAVFWWRFPIVCDAVIDWCVTRFQRARSSSNRSLRVFAAASVTYQGASWPMRLLPVSTWRTPVGAFLVYECRAALLARGEGQSGGLVFWGTFIKDSLIYINIHAHVPV